MSSVPRLISPFDQWILDNEGHVAGVQMTDNTRRTLFRNISPNYGAFLSLTDQTAAANTATAMTYDTTYLSEGVAIASGSQIGFVRDGVYNLQFSAMFTNPEASDYEVSVWLAVNGAPAPGSNTDLTVPSKHGSFNGHAVAAWNFLVQVSAGDYLQLMWSTPITTVFIEHKAAQTNPARPETPSVILTVNQVN